MSNNSSIKIRIFLEETLREGAVIQANDADRHYLQHVMRVSHGDRVKVFNAKDGEWVATVQIEGKRALSFRIIELLRVADEAPDIWLCFAPIKQTPLHYIIQKGTELGVSAFYPVVTRHTVVKQIALEKLGRIAKEAAEQCGRLSVPAIYPEVPLGTFLTQWDPARVLVYCNESGEGTPLVEALLRSHKPPSCSGLLVGPEGGFSKEEHTQIMQLQSGVAVGLGPRILRADTAALAALACMQMVWGDGKKAPQFERDAYV